jgi:hypothetical protein
MSAMRRLEPVANDVEGVEGDAGGEGSATVIFMGENCVLAAGADIGTMGDLRKLSKTADGIGGTGGGGEAERRRLTGGGEPLRPRGTARLTEGENGVERVRARSRVSDLARPPERLWFTDEELVEGPTEIVRVRVRGIGADCVSNERTGGEAGRGRRCLRRTGGEGRDTGMSTGEGIGGGGEQARRGANIGWCTVGWVVCLCSVKLAVGRRPAQPGAYMLQP